jgi:hypothetical protein
VLIATPLRRAISALAPLLGRLSPSVQPNVAMLMCGQNGPFWREAAIRTMEGYRISDYQPQQRAFVPEDIA